MPPHKSRGFNFSAVRIVVHTGIANNGNLLETLVREQTQGQVQLSQHSCDIRHRVFAQCAPEVMQQKIEPCVSQASRCVQADSRPRARAPEMHLRQFSASKPAFQKEQLYGNAQIAVRHVRTISELSSNCERLLDRAMIQQVADGPKPMRLHIESPRARAGLVG